MTEQEVVARIAELIEQARVATEEALNLGREHSVPVELGKIGITEDMWYVDEANYRQEYIADNYSYNPDTGAYMDEVILTPEQELEVEEHMQNVRDEGGYDNGYKVLGWMSSSTNC